MSDESEKSYRYNLKLVTDCYDPRTGEVTEEVFVLARNTSSSIAPRVAELLHNISRGITHDKDSLLYVNTLQAHCPVCLNVNVETLKVEPFKHDGNGWGVVPKKCEECGTLWQDDYKRVDLTIVHKGEVKSG